MYRSILQVVGAFDGGSGQLSLLPDGHAAELELRRDGEREQEAPRLQSDDGLDFRKLRTNRLDQRVLQSPADRPGRQSREDILEKDPLLGKIGEILDVVADEVYLLRELHPRLSRRTPIKN